MRRFHMPVVLMLVAAAAGARAQSLRPPAVPLVAHDPYFSIWSPADRLTDADTMHWTGRPHRLGALARIDGRTFRLMGREPADVPALRQDALFVGPTRTTYHFAGEGVQITLTFLTPALPDRLDVLSRPLTYLQFEAASGDKARHEIALYFEAASEIAVDKPEQEVIWDAPCEDGGLRWVRVGAREQPVLARRGDDLRIDWGHLYVAAPAEARAFVAPAAASRAAFRAGREVAVAGTGVAQAAAGAPVGGIVFPAVPVGGERVTRWLMVAYDDEHSIRYFGKRLRPYWRWDCGDAAALLRKAAAERAALDRASRDFDGMLVDSLKGVGGFKYAQLGALAYRQTLAGNKVVADANGMPLMFPKENFSNGCIGTVDVLFPQAPFFLVLSRALTKAMLVPVLDYAASPLWPYGYAPHDLGTYPHATGQVYGMNGRDGDRMPVEECGNMLIMLAALARVEGNADFSKPYGPMLAKWAEYLVKEGLDPQNQLCSADMFGHLPRNANLALKAIIGIGGYAQLCERWGRADDAAKYLAVARDYAAKWQVLARDEGRTRLAYDQAGSWSMKHNLIWDRVLGLNLFPPAVGDAEIAWYRKVQKTYGLPVDHRTDTSLIDWALWSIAPARDDADFQALLEPIWRYVHETPSRVPLSDWFFTTDAKQKGFQARPVVGGLYIRMLADTPTWMDWSSRYGGPRGPWAPIPVGAGLAELAATALTAPAEWRYTLEAPEGAWFAPGFDDAAWKTGRGGFGTAGTPGAVIGTEWKTRQIWLRRTFTLPARDFRNPRLRLIYDEDPEIYINGVLAARLTGWATGYEEADIAPAALDRLGPGRNVMAVRASQTYGGQCIDVGIVEDAAPPAAEKLPGLRELMDTPLRDTSICRGPDGTWYLTGTVEPFWAYNQGIQVWRSPDLTNWTSMGFVWKYGESPWHKPYLDRKKPLWAPEIHCLKGTFWLTYSLPGWDGTGRTSGCGLLRSTSGRAEGPYVDVQPGERMGDEIDASLFEDDDGTVYYLWHSGKIARMKPDMSGLAEPYRWLKTTAIDSDPKRHSSLCAGIFGRDSFDHVGYEGMSVFKARGLYHLSCAEGIEGRYSCVIATSTNLFGPYGARYEALPHAGHNVFFRDSGGGWWSTYFGSDGGAPWRERAGIFPVDIDASGVVRPAPAR